MATVPYSPIRTVAPSQPLEYSRAAPNADVFGAGIGQAEEQAGARLGAAGAQAAGRVAQATEQLGGQIEHGADVIFKAAEDFQKRQDETDVDAAYSTKFSPAFRGLYQQYYSLQGKDAVDQMVPYITKMQALQQATSESLPNDRQKHLFNQVSRRRVDIELDGMARYADVQNKQYAAETYKSTLDNMALDGADKHNDEQAWGTSLGSMQYVIDKFAADNGKSAEWARDQTNERFSAAATLRVQRMMVDAPEEAQRWYAANQNMIEPKNRPLLEHQIRAAVMPYQIKREAQDVFATVLGPNAQQQIQDAVSGGAPYPAAANDGVMRVNVPDEGTARRVAGEMGRSGQPFVVSVGEPAPTSARDTKAMLGQLVSEAERRYPTDPVRRDALITQIKGSVSTIAAAQTAIQNQAHSTLTGLLTPQNGTPPTTWEELTATPAAQAAAALISPEAKQGLLGALRTNQRIVDGKLAHGDPTLFNQLRASIYLPEGDPHQISSPTQVTQYMARLSPPQWESLRKEIGEAQTPEGNQFLRQVNGIKTTASRMLTQSMRPEVIAHPDIADEAAYRYGVWLDQQIKTERSKKDGGDVNSLFVPGSPNYVLSPNRVASFMPTEAQIKASAAGKVAAPGSVDYNGYRFPNQKALDAYRAAGGK